MWIDIFELTNGDIESVELYWDKQTCYEATFVDEEGIDEKGYVGNDDMGLGRHRIIEIKDKTMNKMLMFILSQYIFDCDKKYAKAKICTKDLKQWLGD